MVWGVLSGGGGGGGFEVLRGWGYGCGVGVERLGSWEALLFVFVVNGLGFVGCGGGWVILGC